MTHHDNVGNTHFLRRLYFATTVPIKLYASNVSMSKDMFLNHANNFIFSTS